MKISVVIPAYNAERTLGRAIEGALSQGLPDTEVVVVDDGSTDGTARVAAGYHVKCVSQKNAGPAAARNAGWRAASGDVVVFTDSDCVPGPGWLAALAEGLEDESAGAVTGSYDIANPERLLPRLIHEEIKDRHTAYGRYVKFFGSYNVAVRRVVLEQTGGFDEGYRRASGEDNDLSYRILKLGYRIAFAPEALVGHYHTTKTWKYLKEQYTHGYWRMKLYKDHPDMASGDDYTKIKDVIEPPLALLNIAAVPVTPIFPAVFSTLTALMAAIQLPAAVRIAVMLRDLSYLWLAPVTFLRGYARGLGLLAGTLRFYAGGEK